ncbi:uncharacterized protein ASCRUDRAFT_10223 [Ascoidea rubescens DSM 1968]|uniref:Thioredoxin-like protein n=1 Tax=Ascoidea rubescens DSM 1968 TaxID=1344418 RepID=A0A1D2VA12_9ASCO|nr:hypothetical protein ASCRUDRAFT_10223 [Ascoidea rubescens DSM 1968]ODV58395.1 hypothetical protein ASCRUDRAFT_10223 [Ascoidea rubescens DSM 1968]
MQSSVNRKRSFQTISTSQSSCNDRDAQYVNMDYKTLIKSSSAAAMLLENYVLIDNDLETSSYTFEDSKRSKNNQFVHKPSLIRQEELKEDKTYLISLYNHLKQRQDGFKFSVLADKSIDKVDLRSEIFSYSVVNNPLLIVFFGPFNNQHLFEINSNYERFGERYPHLRTIGVTSNISLSEYSCLKFPVLDDTASQFSKFFNILDPLGGGVYPQNRVFLFGKDGLRLADIAVVDASPAIASVNALNTSNITNGSSSQDSGASNIHVGLLGAVAAAGVALLL